MNGCIHKNIKGEKMKKNLITMIFGLVLVSMGSSAHADVIQIGVTGVFGMANGTLATLLNQSFDAGFTFDSDTFLAAFQDTTPLSIPGNEYTAAYQFTGPNYGGSFIPLISHQQSVDVRVLDDFSIPASITPLTGLSGIYDVLEVGINNTTGICLQGSCPNPLQFSSADGHEAMLDFAFTSNWVTGGSLPNPLNLSSRVGALFSVLEYDATGEVIGEARGIATIQAVPVPPAVWLFSSALAGLGVIGRRR
jgi:hypothetical protein